MQYCDTYIGQYVQLKTGNRGIVVQRQTFNQIVRVLFDEGYALWYEAEELQETSCTKSNTPAHHAKKN